MADHTPIDPAEPRSAAQQSRTRNETESEQTDVVQTPSTLPKVEDAPPDGGYGWICVACCFFINGKDDLSSHK